MVACSAINCRGSSRKSIRFFRFPANPARRKQWADKCKRGVNWKPSNSSRLCEKHFEESQYEKHRQDGWKKLKVNAVPTLFDVINPPSEFEGKRTNIVLDKINSNSVPQIVINKENLPKEMSVTFSSTSVYMDSNQFEDEPPGNSSNQTTYNLIPSCVTDHENMKKQTVTLPFLSNFVYKDTYSFEEIKPLLLKLKNLYEENQILQDKNISLLMVEEYVDS